MRQKYRLIKVLFSTGMEKTFTNVVLSPDVRGFHIKTESEYLFVPLYNILYISMEGKIENTD